MTSRHLARACESQTSRTPRSEYLSPPDTDVQLRRVATSPLAEKLVVLRVGVDPEPNQPVGRFNGECPMMRTNAGRPEATHLPHAKRRMPQISFHVRKRLVRKLPHRGRQLAVGDQKPGSRGA